MDGSVRMWIGTLPADLITGGALLLDLTMSKLDVDSDGDVTIGYEVFLGTGIEQIFDDGFENGDTSAWTTSQP